MWYKLLLNPYFFWTFCILGYVSLTALVCWGAAKLDRKERNG